MTASARVMHRARLRDKDIRRLFAEGLNDAEIGKVVGMTINAVRNRRYHLKLTRPNNRRTPRKLDYAFMEREFKAGGVDAIPAIAAALNCHPDSVRRALRDTLKLLPRANRAITIEEIERAELLHAEGMPLTWIAEDLGRSPDWIRSIIKPGMPPGWQSVWQSIRQNDELLALHRELAPK